MLSLSAPSFLFELSRAARQKREPHSRLPSQVIVYYRLFAEEFEEIGFYLSALAENIDHLAHHHLRAQLS